MRTATFWAENENDTIEVEVALKEDRWAESVLNDLESANWHDALECFEPLMKMLPKIQRFLIDTNSKESKKLAQKLEKSTEGWERYF